MEQNPHKPVMGEPVKPRLDEIKKDLTGDDLYRESQPVEGEGVKREIYAISAFLMEYYHQNARDLLIKTPGLALAAWENKLKRKSVEKSNGTVRTESHHLEEAEGVLAAGEDGFIVNQEKIDSLSEDAFFDLLTHERGAANVYQRIFQEALPKGSKNMPDKEDAAYHRLSDILAQTDFRIESSKYEGMNKPVPHTPETFIIRGANVASRQAWWLMLSLVVQYNEQYQKPLTEEEFHRLAVDAKKILIKVASMHLSDFNDLHDMRLSRSGGKLHPDTWEPLITLQGEPPAVRASLNKAVMEEFAKRKDGYYALLHHPYEELQHGCPAIIAEGGKGNIIADIVNINEQLAAEILLPRQERIMELTPRI